MSLFRLLHTTDWHIFDPNRREEKLRKGFYKDYINGLHAQVKKQGLEKIDLLVCSGDFIDKGTVQNFEHAKVILDYLLEKFELKPHQIITTVGNHDIQVLDHNNGDMSAYQAFIAHYTPTKIIYHDSIHQIVEYPNKVFVVELNSVFNAEGTIHTDSGNMHIVKPALLTDASIDLVVNNVQTYVTQPNLIIIVSHFPLSINARAEQITEEPNWVEKHLWRQGKFIMQRITDHRLNDNIVCLCGDGHNDNYWSSSKQHHYFMTGMFGGNYLERNMMVGGKQTSFSKTNDAKILEFSQWDMPTIHTFSYFPVGDMYNPQSGEWKAQSGKSVIEQRTSIAYPVENTQPLPDAQDKRVESISSHIQDTILENIKTRNLYFFARTMTSQTESSLGWVSISSLFEVKDLLAASIDKIYSWLEGLLPQDQSKKPILIGLGFWGGILASHINARRDSSCFLISSHRIPHNQVYFESINYVVDSLTGVDFDSVVIITDVISTGNSILRVKNELESKFPSQCKKFVAVSVLSDKNQHRLQQLNEFYKIGSLCIDLPIPVIDNDKLPDHSIFPVEYDFR